MPFFFFFWVTRILSFVYLDTSDWSFLHFCSSASGSKHSNFQNWNFAALSVSVVVSLSASLVPGVGS